MMNTPKTGIINDELNNPTEKPVRNVFQINLIQNRGVNQMAITTATSATIPTASLDELKVLLEGAITERDNADNKIEEIRKAIAAKLQEVQQLNETATNVGTIISNAKRGANQTQTVVQNIVGDTNTVDLGGIWTGFVKYVLPAAIMFFILWILMSMLKSNTPEDTGYNYNTSESPIVCLDDVTGWQLPKIMGESTVIDNL